MKRRLFLFAGYNKNGIVTDALVYYVKHLSRFGDIILVMDCDTPDSEIQKLYPYVLHATAQKHGEYDFGSYRRAYTYARHTAILDKYDFVYLVNDSVYGPLYDLHPSLKKMESNNWDAFGLVCNPHTDHPHIQSWFIGCRKSVFLSKWFDDFIMSVTKLSSKGQITKLYEQGFTKLLIAHNIPWGCLYTVAGRGVYNRVKKLYRAGMPFMKKNAFPRNHGGLGRQILYVLNRVSPDARDAILDDAHQTYGEKYISWLLTRNPIKIILRNLHHATNKVLTGKL